MRTRHNFLSLDCSHLLLFLLVVVETCRRSSSNAYTFISGSKRHHQQQSSYIPTYAASSSSSRQDDFYDIVLARSENDGATPMVRKRIIQEGTGSSPPPPNSQVTIEYTGTLASLQQQDEYWTPQDVVECWLSQQQGLPDTLPQAFVDQQIDSTKLTDVEFFTDEDFVTNTLGVSSKMQCKKLVVAAKRLAQERQQYQATSTVFDSSQRQERGPYTFPLGQNKAIRAVDLVVASMRLGETCQMITRCDYAYGKEGLRSGQGEVRIPPYATLQFEITLIDIIIVYKSNNL
jgi:FKBP-type peptidyl-prolyl cis-trans isomerase